MLICSVNQMNEFSTHTCYICWVLHYLLCVTATTTDSCLNSDYPSKHNIWECCVCWVLQCL